MNIEFFVEEQSAGAVLEKIVPKILPQEVTFNIYQFQGKYDMLKNLPNRFAGLRRWLPDDWWIVVLIDGDYADCKVVKSNLEDIAINSGFITKTNAPLDERFHVMNRLAIQELEAWYFGDTRAMRSAYPRLPLSLGNRASYRTPDMISGGTAKALERVLKQYGYHRSGLAKIKAARDISEYMNPDHNGSVSFKSFRDGLRYIYKQYQKSLG